MNIVQKLRYALLGTQYVVLRAGDYTLVRPVHFIMGQPYAAPYLPETRCKLLPEGAVLGRSYVSKWEPATPAMSHYFNPASE